MMAMVGQAVVLHYFMHQFSLQKAQSHQLELAETLSRELDGILTEAQSDIMNMARHLDLEALRKRDLPKIEMFFQAALSANSFFDNGIFILDADGKGIVDYPITHHFKGMNYSFREYFQRTKKELKPIISIPY